MPDDVDPSLRDADAENNSPEAPPARPGPLQERERMDTGCLLLLMAGFVVVFFVPAVFLVGGAPAIIPLITLLLVAMVTPLINPTEKMAARAKWTGRLITFLGLALILVAAAWFIFMREGPLLRE